MNIMNNVVALCKRRGFIYPSSEIYGGIANSWDFGHYGILLKNNLRDLWWKKFVLDREDMVALDANTILNSKVWQASGHVVNFNDALVDCRNCKFRIRADHLIEDQLPEKKVEGLPIEELTKIIKNNHLKCPRCGKSDFTEVRKFNLLFESKIGVIEGEGSKIYFRGELAQGIFLNFKNIINSLRVKLPFGIAQQGKAFRNEITLGQFIHRTLEFDLMEFEYFIYPQDWEKTFEYWQKAMWQWALELGLRPENLRWREHEAHERAHYSQKTMDIEYKYPFGWKEMFGIAYRTDFDLKNHAKFSGIDLRYFDQKTGERFFPHVIEPTFGLSRLTGIIIFDAYREDEIKGKKRIYLKFNPHVAPVKAAVFPLQKDKKLVELARKIYQELKKEMVVEFDDTGNIGQMYRRQDEIGTPFCLTIDYLSLEDKAVTVRDRDSTKQERVKIDKIKNYLKKQIN
ncbi:MAG: glycine--tRNA ligase [Microgenomates group bacterium]|nr:glycine--tRNA ligase [Microgenomates group bacterium]